MNLTHKIVCDYLIINNLLPVDFIDCRLPRWAHVLLSTPMIEPFRELVYSDKFFKALCNTDTIDKAADLYIEICKWLQGVKVKMNKDYESLKNDN